MGASQPRGVRRWAPAVAGVAAAMAVVALVYLSGPVVIVPEGTVEVVPPFANTTAVNGGLVRCEVSHDCGRPGELIIQFDLSSSARLTGTVELAAPLQLFLVNGGGAGALGCELAVPPSNCTSAAGAVFFEYSAEAGSLDLGGLAFDLPSPTNQMPAGSWELVFANWAAVSEPVTFTAPLTASPD